VKNFYLTECLRFDLRAEFYNAFNMTELGTPNTTVTSQSFGGIIGSSSWRQNPVNGKAQTLIRVDE
jgi:hypothetical protein